MKMNEPASPRDLLDAIEWSYRLFLGREPESANHVREHLIAHQSILDLRRTFMSSFEFQKEMALAALTVGVGGTTDLFKRFVAFDGEGEEGFWFDFLGVKTRCSYLPEEFSRFSGKVFGTPDSRREDIHEIAEWAGMLKAVMEAEERGRLVVAELGAGWGPWLVGAAKAAEINGISEVTLLGVEGAREHVVYMRQHFADNGYDPDQHHIVHAIVGTEDGIARFPRLPLPNEDWGARAVFDEDGDLGDFDEVQSISLATLFSELPVIDLVHCDIQGKEGDVLPLAADTLNARVRRIIVGTHSREIEGKLIAFFGNAGWTMEHESSCKYLQQDSGPVDMLVDGCQVWRNRSLEKSV